MASTLQRWGNSLAVRLPRQMLEQLKLAEGAQRDLRIEGNTLVIAKAEHRPTLKELLEGITPDNRPEELDWGEPAGKEVW